MLTGRNCLAQTGHNDFEHTQKSCPGFFIIATGEEGSDIWVKDGSHKIPDIEIKQRRILAHFTDMELINIPPHSVFVGHGHVQHAGAGWTGTENLRYHMYLIPEGHNMKDAVAFAYGWSFRKSTDPKASIADVLKMLKIDTGNIAAVAAAAATTATTTPATSGAAADAHKTTVDDTAGPSTQTKKGPFYENDGFDHEYTEEEQTEEEEDEAPDDDGDAVFQLPDDDDLDGG